MYVEDFRKLQIYDKAVKLCFTTYYYIEENQLDWSDALKLKKVATRIPVKIAKASAQTNMKLQFKLLNEAKDKILELNQLSVQINQNSLIKRTTECNIELHTNELIKMLNALFGRLSNQPK